MAKLLSAMKNEQNKTFTENDAVTNRSTMNDVLDLFYHMAAKRGQDITKLFSKAYAQNKRDALLVAFNTRDIRGGKGERDLFRQVLDYLYVHDKGVFEKIIQFVPEYGRWDDLLKYYENEAVVSLIYRQLLDDLIDDKPSLLAKWMPSENSGKNAHNLAYNWTVALYRIGFFDHESLRNFGGSPARKYRKMLAELRRRINVVECLMSAQRWSEINYEHVPSRASLVYKDAFKKQDAQRYGAYLAALEKGEAKINATTLYPYDIVNKIRNGYDTTVEALWKALPNYADTNKNIMVVCDTSGSMNSTIANTKLTAMDVALSLTLYVAERNNGIFKNHFITFSKRPELQEIKGITLRDRVNNLSSAAWNMNTDLQAAINLILSTAIKNNLTAEDMPSHLIIVSDMEFDSACGRMTNLEVIRKKYDAAGYTMPVIVFWNVMSRGQQTPATVNDNGVMLVSGASPSIFKSVVEAKTVTPLDLMYDVIHSDRYAPIKHLLDELL